MSTVAIDLLQQFTEPESSRYGIDHQWVKNGWRQATDARVAVRVKTEEPDLIPTDDKGRELKFPEMESIFKPWAADFAASSTFLPIEMHECGKCSSTGRIRGTCGECFGEGVVTCSKCDHEHECHECEGKCETNTPCDSCKNIPVSKTREIDIMYWYRIQSLPGVRLRHVKDSSLFVFDCDGQAGQGIVMHRKIGLD